MSEKGFDIPNICEHGNLKETCEICRNEKTESVGEGVVENNLPESIEQEPDYKAGLENPNEDESEQAPEGWLTSYGLATELNKKGHKVRAIAETFREAHPEWFNLYKARNGAVYEHYSPELIAAITEELPDIPEAPDGWKTPGMLTDELGTSHSPILQVASQYRETNPDWFRYFKGGGGKKLEFYSPELVEIVTKYWLSVDKAEDGWLGVGDLVQELDRDYATIRKTAEVYREAHPEWFSVKRGATGRAGERYAPELIEAIRTELFAIEDRPEGWLTNNELANKLGTHLRATSKAAETFRESHGDWFRKFRAPNGKIFEHYAPELIELIGQEFEQIEIPSEGWAHNAAVARDLDTDYYVVKRMADRYRADNPEWFKQGWSKLGARMTEFYSPELIQSIRQDLLSREKAPADWRTKNTLAGELNLATKTIEEIVSRYRDSNPEFFRDYYSPSHKLVEYYSPDLIERIREEIQLRASRKSEITSLPDVPEGWMNSSQIAEAIGVMPSTVRTFAAKYRDNEEWFKLFRHAKRGHELKYYSPEFVEKIKEEFGSREKAPAGWMTNWTVAEAIGRSFNVPQNIADRYRESNPEWFAKYLGPTNIYSEYYAPELIEIIKNEITEKEFAPEGWETKRELERILGRSRDIIAKFYQDHGESHPEWVRKYLTQKGVYVEHYSPDFVAAIKDATGARETAPSGWLTNFGVSKMVGADYETVQRIAATYKESHPEWFRMYDGMNGARAEHYAPELIAEIKTAIESRESAPDGWKTRSSLSKELSVSNTRVDPLVNPYRESHPEWFHTYLDSQNKPAEHLSPELVALITTEVNATPDDPPQGWVTNNQLADSLSRAYNVIQEAVNKYRSSNPDWFDTYKDRAGRPAEHLSPELCKAVEQQFANREPAPPGWETNFTLAQRLGVTQRTPEPIANRYRQSHPDWFKFYDEQRGRSFEHYSPELVDIITQELAERETPPEGWVTMKDFARIIGTHTATLGNVVDRYRATNPEWFGQYYRTKAWQLDYFSPELVEVVRHQFEERPGAQREKLRKVESTFEKLSDPTTRESKDFRELVNIFGASRSVDILYRLHPSFQGVPVDRVRGMLADYLGDSLLIRPDIDIINIGSIKNLGEYLSDEDLRNGFIEVVKDNCLTYFQEQHRQNPDVDQRVLVDQYFAQLRGQLGQLQGIDISEIVNEAASYYKSLYEDIQKPGHIVDQIREGRAFPDINQRINIKEIEDKHKMLIADEMGLGKSASAILSKETLGVGCALVVAPSNVIPTWQRYLSDEVNGNGKQVGYFKPGQAPRVLTVEDVEDLKNIEPDSYDYVVISQEKLNARHMKELQALDYDMLIVDEVHKLKNVTEGERSKNIVDLAQKVEGDDKYLVMLSGTPVPNKVMDVALILKMLYPDKFGQTKNKDLVRSIIHGDIVDARNLLVPRMQLKKLQESLEMPPLTETIVPVELTKEEEEIYSVLYEDDELTPSEKIAAMRKFLLNPDLLRVSPKIESSKIRALDQEIARGFSEHDSIVVFVNGFIEDVIRGKDSILDKLSSIPEGVEVSVIEAGTSKDERLAIQKRLQTRAGKMLVLVSGQTADVGVDFSGGDHVIFYNEPWTAADKEQQMGRVYREGHTKPLEVRTLITERTIEEGIHHFIAAKKKAVEKLLQGVPLTELEIEVLEKDEKSEPGKEFDPNLAEYYFSRWDRMMKIFSHVREIGEERLKLFLERHGEDYANCYAELGSRAYQANNSRVVASMMSEMIRLKGISPEELRVLDSASGPEMLKQHLPEESQDSVISLDINPHHFDEGEGQRVVGSFTKLPFKDNSMDYCNVALALHYTQFAPSRGVYERLKVLTEMNRVLKPGGRGVISMIFNIDFKDESAARDLVSNLGFTIVEEYTGEAEAGNNYRSHILTLEKVAQVPEIQESPDDVEAVALRVGESALEGLKLKKSTTGRLRDSRRIVNAARLETKKGTKDIPIQFNERDQKIYEEEQKTLHEGHILKSKYRRIEDIPVEELRAHSFARLLPAKSYRLLKLFKRGEGAVVIK